MKISLSQHACWRAKQRFNLSIDDVVAILGKEKIESMSRGEHTIDIDGVSFILDRKRTRAVVITVRKSK